MEQRLLNGIANFTWGMADESVEVYKRSWLFTGDAAQGDGNIRPWGGERLSRCRPLLHGLSTERSCRWL